MMTPNLGYRLKALLLLSGLLLPCLQPSESIAAGYGSLAGVVSDDKGVPLMGATVMVIGPMAFATEAASQTVERMVTDAHGRFTDRPPDSGLVFPQSQLPDALAGNAQWRTCGGR